MSIGIDVEGLDQVRRNLKTVDRQLPRGLTKIHKEVAKPIAEAARPNVNSRSGRLARSIKAAGTQKAASVTAGTGLVYGRINHYGGYPGAYAGNPFLIEAITDEETESVSRYERLLGDFLESVWKDS